MDQEYPQPDQPGWENKYRYAKGLEQASTDLIRFFEGLDSQYIALSQKEKDVEESIDDA